MPAGTTVGVETGPAGRGRTAGTGKAIESIAACSRGRPGRMYARDGWRGLARYDAGVFATLTGAWPRILADGTAIAALEAAVAQGTAAPDAPDVAIERLVREVLVLQAEAGLEPLSDGQVRWPDIALAVAGSLAGIATVPDARLRATDAPLGRGASPLVDAWRATAATAAEVAPGRVVKQAVPGPYSLGVRLAADRPAERAAVVSAVADALAAELADLAAAGCPLVEVEEPAATTIGADDEARALFVAAQRRLLSGAPGIHATLAIHGGSADAAGVETIFGAPYHSYLFDLIAGPDNWRLVAAAPSERGIVCGALRTDGRGGDPAPLLGWAARYAATLGSRGLDRVGLANAGSLVTLGPAAAAGRVRALGRAASLAALAPADAVAAGLDPRAFDARTAAYGRVLPRPRRGRRPAGGSGS